MSVNDDGLPVYRLAFTVSSSGLFTSQIAVPEPAGLSLLAIAGAGLIQRRRA